MSLATGCFTQPETIMPSRSRSVLRTGRFTFRDPTLFFARARLYPDRLELSGWRLRGRYRRSIPIKQVLQVDLLSDDSLMIWLSIGETVRIRIDQAARWKEAIETCQA